MQGSKNTMFAKARKAQHSFDDGTRGSYDNKKREFHRAARAKGNKQQRQEESCSFDHDE